jgi:hypothetical protein
MIALHRETGLINPANKLVSPGRVPDLAHPSREALL